MTATVEDLLDLLDVQPAGDGLFFGNASRSLRPRVFGGQEAYAQRFADVLHAAGADPDDTFSQSFNVNDILYWIDHTPYGKQAVFLVDYDDVKNNILLFDTTGRQLENRQDQLRFFAELRKRKV